MRKRVKNEFFAPDRKLGGTAGCYATFGASSQHLPQEGTAKGDDKRQAAFAAALA